VGDAGLPERARRALALQRGIARIVSPFTILVAYALMRGYLRLRLGDVEEVRRTYRELRRERGPLLVCANHLTMIDSMLIGWALCSPLTYLVDFAAMPWNVPEQRNFASTRTRRVLAYLAKCVPIERGGNRDAVAHTLNSFTHVLASGDTGLIFPEAGRSRSGRVEVERAAYGVGRVVKALPGCRVMCVYLRGDAQARYSSLPARGDRLRVSVASLEPKSDHSGVRGSRDIARQITAKLAEMEQAHFAAT
jgi:hypothetical protein